MGLLLYFSYTIRQCMDSFLEYIRKNHDFYNKKSRHPLKSRLTEAVKPIILQA